jgi:tetratricopeptide (TPR) repeat protein
MTGVRRGVIVLAVWIVATLPGRADRAGAEAECRRGEDLLGRGDPAGALPAFTRAIELDPSYPRAWAFRGRAKFVQADYARAIEDYTRAVDMDPQNPQWVLMRSQARMALDLWAGALEDCDKLLSFAPGLAEGRALRGWALVNLGDVDKGLAEQDAALAARNDPNLYLRFDGYARKADWAAAEKEATGAIAAGNRRPAMHFYRVVALSELGKFAEAAAAIEEGRARSGATAELQLAQAWLAATPGAPGRDVEASLRLTSGGASASGTSYTINAHARTLFLAGRTSECAEFLATRGRRSNFDSLFWLGASQWRLGNLAEARELLKDARRLNPYIAKHAERFEGLKDFVASIDKELAGEGQGGANREKLGHELATHLLTVAEIETLVRRYQFGRAAEEYGKLLGTLSSAVRKAEVEARLVEVRGMAGAHGKLVSGVSRGALKLKANVGKVELAIEKATDLVFDFTMAGGAGKFPWAFLDTAVYCGFAEQAGPGPDEYFGLGCLAWDSGDRPLGVKMFGEALKKKPALKKNLDVFISRRKGIAVPPSGFVLYRGSYVTAEEKANLEKGLVSFEGQWVTAKDREQLAKGNIQVDGKWVPGEEAELLKRGYRKHGGKWMSREDYEALRGQWAEAYTEETAHYIVKTNENEAFAKDLAILAESAYEDFRKYYGGEEPKLAGKEKMQLWGFRTYEDYRKYCVEHKAEDQLNAAGFARSDSNTVVGWNKTGNRQQFLQTMVHEAAHLYWFRVAPMARAPSWHAEGMATYFEGFSWDGKGYKFNHLSESRLPFARDAMKGNRHIALKDLLDGNALSLINSDTNKALLFYAECWALNYYLSETDNPAYKAAYQDFRKMIAGGGQKSLLEFFPDAAKLEADWIRFVTGL